MSGSKSAPGATSLRILLTTLGSHGDLHPFLAIGRALAARGHEATIATHPHFAEDVARAGLRFHSLRPDWDRLAPDWRAGMARYFDRQYGPERVVRELAIPFVEQAAEDTMAIAGDYDVLVSHPLTFATPLIAEKLGKPWASTALAPLSMFSNLDPSLYPPFEGFERLRRFAPYPQLAFHRLGRLATRPWIRPVEALRKRLGVPDRGHPMFEGQHSPLAPLGLFSPLFGPPQPDWPPHARATGFPFYEPPGGPALPEALARFLEAGEPPVVFTLGSAAVHAAGDFYEQSRRAARALRRRAVLLAGREAAERLGVDTGEDVFVCEWASHAAMFPRAAAIVHQGGIGTTAEALRSGRPMLVVPYAHDQPDNAARAVRLGLARRIPRARYDDARAAAVLRELLADSRAIERAAEVGARIRGANGAETAAVAIAELARSR